MLDHTIAIGAALFALALVYFVFRSIARTDVTTISHMKQSKLVSRPSKTKKPKERKDRREDERYQREMDALIAREVARENVSMRSDTHKPKPKLLEEVQKDTSRRPKTPTSLSTAAVEKQAKIDKESGFQPVVNQRKERQQQQHQQQQTSAPKPMLVNEALERKLNHFFSNLNRKEKLTRLSQPEENPTASKGATIIVRKDIANARSWQQQQQ